MDVYIAKVEPPTEKKPLYVIHLEQMLKEGSSCEIDISYTGKLYTNESTGFFKRLYLDCEGETR